MPEFNALGFAQILFAADSDLSSEIVLEFALKHRPRFDKAYPFDVVDYYLALQSCQSESDESVDCKATRSYASV